MLRGRSVRHIVASPRASEDRRHKSSGRLHVTLLWGLLLPQFLASPAWAKDGDITAQAASTAQSDYRINAGDELDISVWGEERMQRSVLVLPDGTISFPLAGTVNAASRTVGDISREIRHRIAPNYRSAPPDVTVAVRDATGMRFYVVGKVRSPGSFSTGRPVDSLQALSMAGGLADFADVKNAVILRQTADGQVVEPVRFASVLKGQRRLRQGALTDPLPVLRSGDVLVIP